MNFIVSLINSIFVRYKAEGMVKSNLKNVLLLLDIAIFIILVLALIGVNISQPVPYAGVILCGIVTLSAVGKGVCSLKKKENENK